MVSGYICGVCLLLTLLAPAITYHTDIQHLGVVLAAALGSMALLAGVAAAGLVAVAVTVTLLLLLVG